MTDLDVLLIERRLGSTSDPGHRLEESGHRVHRCYDPGEPTFPCRAMVEPGSCPIDRHVDVTLVVRPRIAPRPTAGEEGVRCSVRAGVPVVEQGNDLLDPFAPWVALRVRRDGDVVAACEQAVTFTDGPMRRQIERFTARALRAHGCDATVAIRTERAAQDLEVHLDVTGACDKRLDHALAVRVLDAVRTSVVRTPRSTRVFVHGSGSGSGQAARR